MSSILAQTVSVLIPAYNEAPRILQTLDTVVSYLARQPWSSEIIVADDGSRDQTCALVRRWAQTHPGIRLIELPRNRGKGAAVRAAALAAGGAYLGFCDADLAMPISQLEGLVARLREGADVVIGSRALAGSRITAAQGPLRRLMSRSFNGLVRLAFGLPYRDTQCGFKGFRCEAAREIFARSRIDSFAFDVELLVIARQCGYAIVEMPVEVEHSRLTTVRLAAHTLDICRDLWRIARNLRRGRYRAALAGDAPGRQRLSAVIIAKDEERQIARCLESVRWADEIVVVDGMSTDRTVEICKRYGATVIERPFSGSFGEERNAGADAASGEWILQLDGDDVVSQELREAITRLLTEGTGHAAFNLRRKNNFLDHWMMRGGWYHYYHMLYRKEACRFKGRVHHTLDVTGTIGVLEAPVLHFPFTSLEQFVAKQNRYTSLEAKEILDEQGVLDRRFVRYQVTWKPVKLFWKSYVKKQGFREGWHGLVFALLYSWVHFLKWAKYWELVREREPYARGRLVS